jgi:hypothetical protein
MAETCMRVSRGERAWKERRGEEEEEEEEEEGIEMAGKW